jgi:hypothetical protein
MINNSIENQIDKLKVQELKVENKYEFGFDELDNLSKSSKELNTSDLEKELTILQNKYLNDFVQIKLSEEQKSILESESNVIVNSCAGSGKSTVILHYALKYPKKKMIQITYNNMLKHEIRKKASMLEINNLVIHTYHSLAVRFYNPKAYTDEEIKKILLKNTECNCKEVYDVILIDETQDMMTDYYLLIKKFIGDTQINPQILIFGDKYQGIYEFKGANTKFLTLGDKIWKKDFKFLTLNTSFRMTNNISWFINNCMGNLHKISTIKDGPLVDYYICNSFKIYEIIGKKIIYMIKKEGLKEEDFFILSPSVKTENPYKKLENFLVSHGLKCMTPISDDAKLDDKIINNKIVFTTYHQAKGRERKVVILYSFDNSQFKYYLKEENPLICPNILYVGVTRAMYKLILLQDSKFKSLDFLNLNVPNISQHVNIYNIDNIKINYNQMDLTYDHEHKSTVTDLIKFIDSYIMDNIILLMENIFITIIEKNIVVDVPCKISIIDNYGKETFEDVSDLNGLVIPAIYEKLQLNTSTIEEFVSNSQNKKFLQEIKKYIKKVNIPCKKISDYLKVGNIYLSINNKLHSKLAQIKKYNWINKKIISNCHKNMKILNNKNLIFEKTIGNNSDDSSFTFTHKEFGRVKICGRIDAFDDESVYEFKCVDHLSIDHKLQLILYAWLWINSDLFIKYGKRNFKLLNIKTGELLGLKLDMFIIGQIVELILANKFIKKTTMTDKEFIGQIHKLENKIIKNKN